MMGLDHFDIRLLTHHAGSDLQQFEAEIDPNTHVRREYDADLIRRIPQPLPIGRVETGGADHHSLTGLCADRQVLTGGLRGSEIDHHIERIEHPIQPIDHSDVETPHTGYISCVMADMYTTRALGGGSQLKAVRLLNRPDQHVAHASGHSDNSYPRHRIPQKIRNCSGRLTGRFGFWVYHIK